MKINIISTEETIEEMDRIKWKTKIIAEIKVFITRNNGGKTNHLRPLSKSKFNLKSDRANLVTPASPIECLRAIQYKLGPEKLTRLGNSNVLRLPMKY